METKIVGELQAEVDMLKNPELHEEMGALSQTEAGCVNQHIIPMRRTYERVLETTRAARDQLLKRLFAGIPPSEALPGGGYDAMAAVQLSELVRVVNAYAVSSRCLWRAAQAVCDIENLEDDGVNEGIIWEVTL